MAKFKLLLILFVILVSFSSIVYGIQNECVETYDVYNSDENDHIDSEWTNCNDYLESNTLDEDFDLDCEEICSLVGSWCVPGFTNDMTCPTCDYYSSCPEDSGENDLEPNSDPSGPSPSDSNNEGPLEEEIIDADEDNEEIDETCYDQIDNNANGLTDCEDPACNEQQCGSYPGSQCINNICTELICNDGLDNDHVYSFICGDGQCEDMEDPWCEIDCVSEGCELPPQEAYITESSCENVDFLWGIGAVYDNVCTDKLGVGEKCDENEDCFWQPVPFVSPGDSCIDEKCIAHSDIYILLGASPSLCDYDSECSPSKLCKPVAVGYLEEQCLCKDNKVWNSTSCQCEFPYIGPIPNEDDYAYELEQYFDLDEEDIVYQNAQIDPDEIQFELGFDLDEIQFEPIFDPLDGGWTDPSPQVMIDQQEGFEQIVEDSSPGPIIIIDEGLTQTIEPVIQNPTSGVNQVTRIQISNDYSETINQMDTSETTKELVATFISGTNYDTTTTAQTVDGNNNLVQTNLATALSGIGLTGDVANMINSFYNTNNIGDGGNMYAAAIGTNLIGFASITDSDGTDCSDDDCNNQLCDGGYCVNGECVEANYAAPAPIIFEIEPAYQIQTYYDFLIYLNEGTFLTSENIMDNYNGICDDYCSSLGGICGFANSGLNACSSEGSNSCICYDEIE